MKRMILFAVLLLCTSLFAAAEIAVYGGAFPGVQILSGDTTPQLADGTILPDAIQQGPATSSTFRIWNVEPGVPNLRIYNVSTLIPYTFIPEPNFSVTTNPVIPFGGLVIPYMTYVDVTISFLPVIPVGNITHYAAALSFNNDMDGAENPFWFMIQGTAINASAIQVYVIDDANANGVWDLNEVGILGVETWIKGKSVDGCDGQSLTGQRGGTSYQKLYWQKYDVAIQTVTLPAGYKLTNGGAKRTVKAPTYDGEVQVVFLASAAAPAGGSAASEANNWGFIPDSYGMSQNYPNPFNPTTAINYALKEDVHVTLQVYDITGRLVATLVDGVQNAGHHVAEFNAANLPSGSYLYKIQAGNYSATRNMMLLK